MLELAASKLGVVNPENCVVLGDTVSDMEAAVAFGAGVRVGVLSGAHDSEALKAAGATAVIGSVADLPNLLFN
jgi:phosphoglycolate phosphatase-like HAD superfamily hydrolase